ncbi:MAG: hypothetical protein WBA23_25620 [Tunicatimonas sp.]|uniref:hypothetical protein n=1 Tax=Tunicatimonas sp. TaxID=1940096 RepID=UPI003C7967E5
MKIQFTKQQNRPSVFKCFRPDGTETWMSITQLFALEHDIVHYAVETTLGFRQAFYGMLLRGYNVTDFAAPRHLRPAALLPINLPLEAQQTEMLVNLFQTELHDGTSMEDFIGIAKFTFEAQVVPFPDINEQQVGQIRARIRALLRQWHELPTGATLELNF